MIPNTPSNGNQPPKDPRRQYESTRLPTLTGGMTRHPEQDLLLRLYEEACGTWRELVGIRFKLLGIVPAVSVALLVSVLSSGASTGGLTKEARVLIALIAGVATLGLWIYDARNSVLHDDMISRARKIEQELGVETGIFLGRLKAGPIVKHGAATALVYAACILGWISALVLLLRT